MSFKYLCFGSRGDISQIDRIEKGLDMRGGERHHAPDFIYSNDAGTFEEAINYKINVSPSSYLILCLLDIPEHIIAHYDLEKVKSQLLQADKIVCISKFVKSQIKKYFNLESEVVYNPVNVIYPDFPDDKYSKFDFLFASRSNDPNKRTNLGAEALIKLGYHGHEILCIGPENPNFGSYYGVVSPKELHKIYNSVKFVFCLGKNEGIGLQSLESLCGNSAIPIVLNDCSTYEEFFGESKDILNINPNSDDIARFISNLQDPINFNYTFEKLRERHLPFIHENFTFLKVADKILDIFKENNRLLVDKEIK